MCTATLIPIPGGYRLVHSRDELRTRSAAEPPAWRDLPLGDGSGHSVEALAPLDPDAGGTWIAVDRRGRAVAVMNANPPVRGGINRDTHTAADALYRPAEGGDGSRPISRGLLAGLLLGVAGWPPECPRLRELAARMRPHRAVVVDPGAGPGADPGAGSGARPGGSPRVAVWSGGGGDGGRWSDGAVPGVWVSSGLGDDRVAPRVDLFEEGIAGDGFGAAAQDRFHRHRWADRPEISVLMERADARTVSITTVEVAGDRVRMAYEEVASTGEVGSPETTEALVRSG
mgnify:CR=1 FL=1